MNTNVKIKNYTSIIFSHYAQNQFRSELLRESLNSLIETTKHLPVEIIVVDNGEDLNDSEFLLHACSYKKIHCYIRNSENMNTGFANNQCFDMAKGDNIVITCNDVLYKPKWLDECLEILESFPSDKIYATPIDYPGDMQKRYFVKNIIRNNKTYKVSLRAGSNCMVLRRSTIKEMGTYPIHRVEGSIYMDRLIRAGYTGIVTLEDMIVDGAYRRGRNFKEIKPIQRTLLNGDTVYFNVDEYRLQNPDKPYYDY
jgi:glycosyltransferase involved in cell wall biosynthesis